MENIQIRRLRYWLKNFYVKGLHGELNKKLTNQFYFVNKAYNTLSDEERHLIGNTICTNNENYLSYCKKYNMKIHKFYSLRNSALFKMCSMLNYEEYKGDKI